MNEVKSPKKPLLYYYFVAMLLVMLFMPWTSSPCRGSLSTRSPAEVDWCLTTPFGRGRSTTVTIAVSSAFSPARSRQYMSPADGRRTSMGKSARQGMPRAKGILGGRRRGECAVLLDVGL